MSGSDSHVLVALRFARGRGTCLLPAQDDIEQVPASLCVRGFFPHTCRMEITAINAETW